MRQRTWFPSFRGAHGSADAAHHPQDKRFTFGIKHRCVQSAAPSAHHPSGQKQEFPRERIGRGSPPPRAVPVGSIIRVCAIITTTDNPHPQFPDALMARHKAGERGAWSGTVPASAPSVRCSRSKGLSARLLTLTAYHIFCCAVKRCAPVFPICSYFAGIKDGREKSSRPCWGIYLVRFSTKHKYEPCILSGMYLRLKPFSPHRPGRGRSRSARGCRRHPG